MCLPSLILLQLKSMVVLVDELVIFSSVSETVGIHKIDFSVGMVPRVRFLKRVFMRSVRLIDSLIILLS